MDFKIKRIILWPKNDKFYRKEIEFELELVNVIVGDSQTGKSAIIPIIDYCLGSSKCTIPVGPIRKTTDWFGIVVVSGELELLLARQEPGVLKATNQMYYEEGKKVQIPERILESNRSSSQVVNRLNQLCRLPSLGFASNLEEAKAYEAAPSFKDFTAFCFQPQHIIANPFTLFYEADTIEHKLKLRTIFPLALGLIQANTLELQRRLSGLMELLKEKKGVLSDKNKIRDAWDAEIRGNYIRALELGILKDSPFPDESWKLEDYVIYLQQVPELTKQIKFPGLSDGITSRVLNYITKIQKNENDILNVLEEKTYRLSLLKSFKEGSTQYELAIKNQQSRLEPVTNGWLYAKLKENNNCPVCGSRETTSNDSLQQLVEVANSIKEKILQINDSKDILDKEVSEIEKEIQELEKQLNSTRTQLEALGRQNEQIERQRRSLEELYRYVGRIEQNLKNLEETRIESNLSQTIADIENQIAHLQSELAKTTNLKMRDNVMKRIGLVINHYKKILRVEDAENPTEIDEKQLTLKITSGDNRDDYLWEIGSGSNWMGYHISALLALHEHFLSLKEKNHIPSFIIFDQPSQAYFPDPTKLHTKEPIKESDDLDRVKGIFKAFSTFLKRSQKKCQIIVLEHAGKAYWEDIELIKQVGGRRWIKGDALIPQEWLS